MNTHGGRDKVEIFMSEGKVEDLAEKLRKREITPEEALRELKKRGLDQKETWKDFIGYVV